MKETREQMEQRASALAIEADLRRARGEVEAALPFERERARLNAKLDALSIATTDRKYKLPSVHEALAWADERRAEFGPTGEIPFEDGSKMIFSHQDLLVFALADEVRRLHSR